MSAEAFQAVVDEHHARLERIVERRGVARLRRVYDEAQAEVAARLKRLVRAGQGDSFSAHQQRLVLAQLVHGQAMVADRMAGELGDAARDAQRDTLHALARDIGRLESKFAGAAPVLPIEDAALFMGVVDKRASSLMRRHDDSLKRYGARNVSQAEEALAKSLLKNETPLQAIDRIGQVLDTQWWEGERIVRTELSYAANATQHDGIKAARQAVGDLMMQWRELVSDSGRPLDDRVGVDSLALHGQVAAPGQMFKTPSKAPDGEKVSASLAFEEIAFPPNRPNDRASVVPWRAGWGMPGWRFINGRRVPVR